MKIIDDIWWLTDEQKEQLTKVAVHAGNLFSKSEGQLVAIMTELLQKAHLPSHADYKELTKAVAVLREKVLDLEEKIAKLEEKQK